MLSGESRAGAEGAAATRAEQRLPANKDFLGRRGGRESAARWTGAAGGGASLPVPAPFPGRAAEMRARWAGPGRAAFLWLVVAGSMSVSRSWTLARVLCLVNHGAGGSASLHGGSNRVIHTNTEQIWGRPRSPQTSALAAGVRAAR